MSKHVFLFTLLNKQHMIHAVILNTCDDSSGTAMPQLRGVPTERQKACDGFP